MITKLIGRRTAAAVASLLITGGLGGVVAAPAEANVPNRYYCNPNGGWCYQVNGPHVASLPDICHWKRSGMNGKPKQIYYTSCDGWSGDIP